MQQQALTRISLIASDVSPETQPRTPSQSPEDVDSRELPTDSFDQDAQDSEDDITQQISRRLGRMCLAEGGQMRYFGATSHFSMLRNELGTLYHSDMSNFREEGETMIRRAQLTWNPDPDYELHLTRLYFAWHNPWVSEVEQASYLREKELYYQGYESALFSPALENSMSAT